jgi:biopolymer transport protein ExbD
MNKFHLSEFRKQTPTIQMAPLIDIIFLTLVFFITTSVFSQMESEINISVPKSGEATESMRSPGEIIVNVTRKGEFIVNQKHLDLAGLEEMLKEVASLFPDQPVIIRADEKTYHKNIINVLDTCARANIWDISFATASKSH